MWIPQPGPQSAAYAAAHHVPELFFGGARGGGKTDYMLGDYLQDINQGSGWRGIIFRRTYPELDEVLQRARAIYTPVGGVYRVSERTWTFPGGATLKLRHLESDADIGRYQGHQYTWIGWDELPQWSRPDAYLALFACLRSVAGIKGKRVRATGNPGGPGHQWVKARFVDPHPGGMRLVSDGGHHRLYVPSRVTDNRLLTSSDPEYIDRLRMSGSPELVRAWLDGDWSVVTGAYFDFRAPVHVCRPWAIPEGWTRFRSLDWGSSRPFSVGWWAVADRDDLQRGIRRGALIRYREWYGCVPGAPNTGLKITADDVARGIVARTAPGERIAYTVADPSMWATNGGPSLAERMASAGVAMIPGDNARAAGWDQVRARMALDGDGLSGLVVFDTCADSIRTVPALQHDRHRPEDLDSDGEDHAADDWRYACMSRPVIMRESTGAIQAPVVRIPTFNDLLKGAARRF